MFAFVGVYAFVGVFAFIGVYAFVGVFAFVGVYAFVGVFAFDNVFVLGNVFAFEEYNVVPDVLLLSKQITNGYMPLGVCILSNNFNFENKDIKRGSTTAGNPISCAAATASIELIQQSFLARKHIEKRLKEFSNMFIHRAVYKFEHCGCFASLHFSQNKDNLKLFDYNIGGEIAKLCYKKGLIIRGNPKSIILAPGFNMSDLQVDFAIKTIMDSIDELLD